ncbi:signal peptidase I [Gordonia sp. NPDC003376]
MADTNRSGDDRRDDHRSDDEVGSAEEPTSRPWRTKDDKPKGGRGSLLRETIIIVACVLLISWILQTFIGRQYVIPSESMEPTLIGCDGCTNDRIVVDKLSYRFGDPTPGDVVVFKVPDSWGGPWVSPRSSNTVVHGLQDAMSWFGFAPPDENDYVKRIVAVGGQTIECDNNENVGVTVDGKPLHEPYVDMALQRQNLAENLIADADAVNAEGQLTPCLGKSFGPIKVPEGHAFMMGDNRTRSSDSRYHIVTDSNGVITDDGTVPIDNIRGKTRFVIYPFSRMGGVAAINPQQ